MRGSWMSAIVVGLFLIGCGDSAGTGASSSGGSGGSGASTNVGGRDEGGGGSASAACGDGVLDPGENCDGANLDGADCVQLGFGSGTLLCTASCTFDTGGCIDASCGDGVADGLEDCDGADLGGGTCMSEGFDGGTLGCTANCIYDTESCTRSSCGNGTIDGLEDCDGANLNGATCTSLGHTGGTLSCTANCIYNEGACTDAGGCGDGTVGAGEECDDGNTTSGDGCSNLCVIEGPPGTWTCDPGFYNAADGCDCSCGAHDPDCDQANMTLYCTGNAAPAGTTCVNDVCVFPPGVCGDGTVDAGEECDDGDTISGDGCSATCTSEVPAGWTCNLAFYDQADGCDCSCGIHDPDCDIVPAETLFCDEVQASPGTTCVNDVCVVPPVVCGNGLVQTGEECDDGNTVNGDGCSSTCQDEPPPPTWTCNLAYYNALDGCDCSCGAHDPDCNVAGQNLFCGGSGALPGQTCVNDVCVGGSCGNGTLDAGEECDDGNSTSGDGCSSTCQTEVPASWTCDDAFYNALDGCDCSCGAHDPDCNVAGQTLFCNGTIAPAGTVCTNDVCVP